MTLPSFTQLEPDQTQTDQLPLATWTPRSTAVPLDRVLGAQHERSQPRSPRREVVVAPGDTLWSLAQEHLGNSASLSEIAEYWPEIYAGNRAVIGADPDLLAIGTVLQLPTSEA